MRPRRRLRSECAGQEEEVGEGEALTLAEGYHSMHYSLVSCSREDTDTQLGRALAQSNCKVGTP